MARFRAVIQGQRGPASRLGSPGSGIRALVNGWHSGVRVEGFVSQNGEDTFTVVKTWGSSGGDSGRVIARILGDEIVHQDRDIVLSHVRPPIPMVQFDWAAWRDGNEESGPIGYGPTPQGAVQDLRTRESEL